MAVQRKEKKTFSLSSDAVKYLEDLRKSRREESVSAVLEDLIRRQRRTSELQGISASVTRYYDSLSDEEAAEDGRWGRFAETQLPGDE